MPKRVRFTRDYDHPVDPRTDVAYKAGSELLVPSAHADAAVAAGAADILPRQGADPAPDAAQVGDEPGAA
jgi:hypothetical protein